LNMGHANDWELWEMGSTIILDITC
jgi:hypothetical protein